MGRGIITAFLGITADGFAPFGPEGGLGGVGEGDVTQEDGGQKEAEGFCKEVGGSHGKY